MNKEQKNNYYNDEDLVNFEKLKNFKKLKENKVETIKKSHPQKYSTFDKENFEKIININSKKTEHKNEEKLEKNSNDYKSLDIENFEKIKRTFTNNNDKSIEKINNFNNPVTRYTNSDQKAFDQIIKTNSQADTKIKKNIAKVDKSKIKIIDFDKLNEKEKNLKNKVGVEKIKIVYFD